MSQAAVKRIYWWLLHAVKYYFVQKYIVLIIMDS